LSLRPDGVVGVSHLGPVGVHHLVGGAAEQERVGLGEPAVDDLPHAVVDVGGHPATVPESAGAILDAAVELCNEHGYEQLTVEAIARHAGVGKQTIYRWWSSKADVLLDAVVDRVGDEGPPFPDTGDLRADLRSQMLGVVALMTDPSIGQSLTALFVAGQWDPELTQRVLDRIQRPRILKLEERLRAAVEQGQLRADVDLEVVEEQLYGPFYYRLLLQIRPLTPEMVDPLLAACDTTRNLSDPTGGVERARRILHARLGTADGGAREG
jgi:AcrR family transcriptional regulator